jgi:hypothetical protein
MNTVFALMIVTTMGVTEAPNPFSSLAACEKVSSRIEKSYCVEKRPVDIEKEMNRMVTLMKSMMNSMKEQQ